MLQIKFDLIWNVYKLMQSKISLMLGAWNFQQTIDNTFHHTLSALLHYLGNSEIQIC